MRQQRTDHSVIQLTTEGRVEQARLHLMDCRMTEAEAHAATIAAEGALDALVSERIGRKLPRLMTAKDVATMVQVDETTVQRWAKEGRLPRVAVGNQTARYLESDVMAFIHGQRNTR
jgi:excisionase family DNA binding protein